MPPLIFATRSVRRFNLGAMNASLLCLPITLALCCFTADDALSLAACESLSKPNLPVPTKPPNAEVLAVPGTNPNFANACVSASLAVAAMLTLPDSESGDCLRI